MGFNSAFKGLTELTCVTATESDKWEEPAVDKNVSQKFWELVVLVVQNPWVQRNRNNLDQNWTFLSSKAPCNYLTNQPTSQLCGPIPSWDITGPSGSQLIPRILRNPKDHYHVHNSPPLVPFLSQFNPGRTLSSYLAIYVPFQYYPTIYAWVFQTVTFLRIFLPNNSMYLSSFSHASHAPISAFLNMVYCSGNNVYHPP